MIGSDLSHYFNAPIHKPKMLNQESNTEENNDSSETLYNVTSLSNIKTKLGVKSGLDTFINKSGDANISHPSVLNRRYFVN